MAPLAPSGRARAIPACVERHVAASQACKCSAGIGLSQQHRASLHVPQAQTFGRDASAVASWGDRTPMDPLTGHVRTVSRSKHAVAGAMRRYEALFNAVLSACGNFVKAAIDNVPRDSIRSWMRSPRNECLAQSIGTFSLISGAAS